MNPIAAAFAAGYTCAAQNAAHKIERLRRDNDALQAGLDEANTSLKILTLDNLTLINTTQNRIIMTARVSDDNQERIIVSDKDALGVSVDPGTLSAMIDRLDKATITTDPDNPNAFIVSRLPAADGDPAILTVTVTITDTASGITGTQVVEFDPGKAATMSITTELVEPASSAADTQPGTNQATPAAPAVGDTVSLPSDPADPSSPPADHTVTAVDPASGTVTAQPVSGGDPVTVAASSTASATS